MHRFWCVDYLLSLAVTDKADQEPQQQPQQQQPRKPRQRHHFWGVAEAEGPVPSTRQRRLVRELRSLARELPLYWGSTIAVRVDEDRPHLLKASARLRERAFVP